MTPPISFVLFYSFFIFQIGDSLGCECNLPNDFNPVGLTARFHAISESHNEQEYKINSHMSFTHKSILQLQNQMQSFGSKILKIQDNIEDQALDLTRKFQQVRQELDVEIERVNIKIKTTDATIQRLDGLVEFYKKNLDKDLEDRKKETEKVAKANNKNKFNDLFGSISTAPTGANPMFPIPTSLIHMGKLVAESILETAQELIELTKPEEGEEPDDGNEKENNQNEEVTQPQTNSNITGSSPQTNLKITGSSPQTNSNNWIINISIRSKYCRLINNVAEIATCPKLSYILLINKHDTV